MLYCTIKGKMLYKWLFDWETGKTYEISNYMQGGFQGYYLIKKYKPGVYSIVNALPSSDCIIRKQTPLISKSVKKSLIEFLTSYSEIYKGFQIYLKEIR